MFFFLISKITLYLVHNKNMISSIIVLYNPDVALLTRNITSIGPQVDFIILIDNGSETFRLSQLDFSENKLDKNKILYYRYEKNMGIAFALNRGVEISKKQKCEWTITLDQDSIVPRNIISEYRKVVKSESNCGIVTCKINFNDTRTDNVSNEIFEVSRAITSASFVNIAACYKVGGFDEAMFIDGVDYEYCYRLKMNGYKIIRTGKVTLDHELGDMKVKSFLWKKVSVENHNAFRVYYISRNYIYCKRKYAHYYSWGTCMSNEVKLLLKVFFYENEKIKKIKRMTVGIHDGFTMKIAYNNFLK